MPVKISTDTALALKVQCGLSVSQYQLLRNAALQHNSDIFPTLENINQEKSKALPSPESIEINETSAQCSLRGLMDYTLARVIEQTPNIGKVESARICNCF